MPKTKNVIELFKRRCAKDAELQALYEEEKLNFKVATLIRSAREESGLTQSQLAKKIGTTQSVISRLEDADYEGHSLSMLQRIAHVLHRNLEVNMSAIHVNARRPRPAGHLRNQKPYLKIAKSSVSTHASL